MIWKQPATPEGLNAINANSLAEHMGITFTEVGPDFIAAQMPVDHRHVQPMRILHGGASVVLAETLGSVASVCCLDDMTTHSVVGVEINANHLNSVPEGGIVTGIVRPIKVGRTLHVWQIELTDQRGRTVCVSRITIAVVARRVP